MHENAKVNYLMEEHPSTNQAVFPIAILDSGNTRLIKWFFYQPNEVFSLLMTGTFHQSTCVGPDSNLQAKAGWWRFEFVVATRNLRPNTQSFRFPQRQRIINTVSEDLKELSVNCKTDKTRQKTKSNENNKNDFFKFWKDK